MSGTSQGWQGHPGRCPKPRLRLSGALVPIWSTLQPSTQLPCHAGVDKMPQWTLGVSSKKYSRAMARPLSRKEA